MANIANHLSRQALAQPAAAALIMTRRGRADLPSLSYADLDQWSNRLARGFQAVGLGRGVRSVVMVKPGPEFFAIMFGLFKAGAVPVMIDPGIDRKALKTCIAEAQVTGFIGIPLAQIARLALGWGRGQIRTPVTVGRRWAWGGLGLAGVERAGAADDALAEVDPDDPAAILFTSGSTGIPKGVLYRHRHFSAQVEMLRARYAIQPGEVNCPTFPPFALFDPALGMCSVIPDMDFTRPARVDPAHLVDLIQRHQVSNLFGSPALLDTLGRHLVSTTVRLPSLRRVLSAGAPVPESVLARIVPAIPADARVHTPYGATECLPVASIDHCELDSTFGLTRAGAGVCVGRPVEPNLLRVIGIDDDPLQHWHDGLLAPRGQVGEITVRGPSATDTYFGREAATRVAKIQDGDAIVHRMGDVGYLDGEGRLWYCGRKSHRVVGAQQTWFTEQVEPIFNTHPAVRRSALVGLGERGGQQPLLIIEREVDAAARALPWSQLESELRAIAAAHPGLGAIQRYLEHPAFPVDIRHNAKIGREALAVWAAAQ